MFQHDELLHLLQLNGTESGPLEKSGDLCLAMEKLTVEDQNTLEIWEPILENGQVLSRGFVVEKLLAQGSFRYDSTSLFPISLMISFLFFLLFGSQIYVVANERGTGNFVLRLPKSQEGAEGRKEATILQVHIYKYIAPIFVIEQYFDMSNILYFNH